MSAADTEPQEYLGNFFSTVEEKRSGMNGASQPMHLQAQEADKKRSHKIVNIPVWKRGVTLTTEQVEEKVLNLKAWNHLVMACLDSAFIMLTTATLSNAFNGWSVLLEEYHKNDINSLVDIESDFATCKLDSENKDPSLWIGQLKIINKRLAKIGPAYKKNEYNLISHVFANLPQKLYMNAITTMRVIGLQSYDLKKVVIELRAWGTFERMI
jgi:hypothetical protein